MARELEIISEIRAWAKQHTLAEVLAAMQAARVPAGPILSTAELMQEQQFQERGMIERVPVLGSKETFTMPAILPMMHVS